jgi:hypothetical protein
MAKQKGKVMPRYSISLTPKGIEQIEAIQDELGYASISEAVRGCIAMVYNDTFPRYIRQKREAQERRTEKLKEKKESVAEEAEPTTTPETAKQTKEAQALATAVHICEVELNGVVGEDDNGRPATCAYFQYEGRRRYEQEIAIDFVTADLVSSQYNPSKDRVLQLQADGNVDYDPSEHIADVLNAEEEN